MYRIQFILSLTLILLLTSCFRNKRAPGRVYMPEMMNSIAYEPLAESHQFEDGMAARLPVEGTIPRGVLPDDTVNSLEYLYQYYSEATEEYYISAGKRLHNPVKLTPEVLAEGKRLFDIHCIVCHGEIGQGNGYMVEKEKFPAVPTSYYIERIMEMPMGRMYHVLQYGRNMMGSYSSQLNSEQRWTVLHYVKQLQRENVEIYENAILEQEVLKQQATQVKQVVETQQDTILQSDTVE